VSQAVRRRIEMSNTNRTSATRQPSAQEGPHLLNVKNGTIDLNTGKLRHHLRTDLASKLIPINHDPKAHCPTFMKFLDAFCLK